MSIIFESTRGERREEEREREKKTDKQIDEEKQVDESQHFLSQYTRGI